MKVVLNGSDGFLGWHTRLRLHASAGHEVVCVNRDSWPHLGDLARDADALIHVAGVNRADSDSEVQDGNIALANDVANALRSEGGPRRVIYANSIQAGNGTAYGTAKQEAGEIIRKACSAVGAHFVDIRLPNLFGEHGRPHYNSFVATFIDTLLNGTQPYINDAVVSLAHAQDAAQAIVGGLTTSENEVQVRGEAHGVREVWELLQEFESSYASGEFPDLSTQFRVDLFNSFRSAVFPSRYPIALTPHSDARGTFVETVRVRGGEGQTSLSTTHPGMTRGNHYHLRKIERFAVIQGDGLIALRRMFTSGTVLFNVSGSAPAAVDMPTGWVHSITNTGDTALLTQFWSHELFDPAEADTFPHNVNLGESP